MTEIGEQTLRELVSRYKTFEMRDVALIQLPRGPVFVATVEGPRAPTPAQIKYAEDLLRKRLDDSSATLLVRAVTLVNSSAKGRILLGEAQFGALSAEDQALQARIETETKTAIERLGNTFVESIDAAPDDRRWNVRAEVIGAEPLRPSDVRGLERTISGAAQKPVALTVLTPGGLIVNAEGFTTVQRAVEAEFARRLAAGVVDDSVSPPRGAETIPLPRN
jgi:hypothetical protein